MPDHLVFPFKPFPPFRPGTALDRAVVGSRRRVDVGVRVQQVLCLERLRSAAGDFADVEPELRIREAVDAHPVLG